jgi:isopenicillin N synthase-like dioxygenase
MLAREDVPGLGRPAPERRVDGAARDPGTFLVNLGNIMKRWSNDRFLSTPHGVLNDSGEGPVLDRRSSTARTSTPRSSASPTCVSADNPARYPRAVYRDLVLEFYNANYFHRKDYAGATTEGATRPRP